MNFADQPDYLRSYSDLRRLSEAICAPLYIEDHVPQPAAFVSPPKWHLAHTTWFFEEFILKPYKVDYKVFHEDFSFMFNSYYNTIGKRVFRADRGNMTRPSLEHVHAYRQYVDQHMQGLLKQGLSNQLLSLLKIGINHEQQHQELLITDLKYILGHNPLFPIYKEQGALVNDTNTSQGIIGIDEGVYEIGAEANSGFTFDNEHNRHKVYVNAFEIENKLVTNGEYIDFIKSGAYSTHNLWLDDAWAWINENKINAPMYWHKIDGQWFHFTLSGLQPINRNEILSHVSHYEAAGFAAFAEKRLPTEAEWEIASPKLDWGKRWEHSGSAYLAYPSYKKPDGAVGEYNGKFMMNQMVLRGASVATSPMHSRNTYRNFFQPNLQWQFSGIRLVKNG
ncbi:MAG: ergothioneine biosynthesis protein EgtB [Salibacteraceae bacterium]|jgi:ergothioneine biosynthesis protein EgtB|nr:ergothioneine biosynthesis protein EgtB [Salibacteraceae bacterium]MDP4763588.1 ergothioneine biosynthesis protein EgtB [Salibacteraceae bacterium]MDP4843255.1 ergothioneine biosynthesis protein EgtB [Salibacteraceae bacterium]MDP4965940.1 ergothioneine biosynthesis protein EgtB [Salibacteraceae bacterium]